jgi:hypothetical protein
MKITVLRSEASTQKSDPYEVCLNTSYSKRFLGHIQDKGTYCFACGERCISCRKEYDLDFSESIQEIITFPSVLPAILDEPEAYMPEKVKNHDILVAISVHEEILFSFVKHRTTARGILIPIEEPWWISPYMRGKLKNHCSGKGIEIAFPKPFCSLDPHTGVLRDFKERFKVGKPEISFTIVDKRIAEAHVLCSAPCGATYFVARNLRGRGVDNELVQSLDSLLSAYPCTASTEVDRDFGDSIIHWAVQIQRDVLRDLSLH